MPFLYTLFHIFCSNVEMHHKLNATTLHNTVSGYCSFIHVDSEITSSKRTRLQVTRVVMIENYLHGSQSILYDLGLFLVYFHA